MYIYRVRYITQNEISKESPLIRKYKEKYTAITRSYIMLRHIYIACSCILKGKYITLEDLGTTRPSF